MTHSGETPADRWVSRHSAGSDVPAIVDLITSAYRGANLTNSANYWRWKHEENPFGPSPILLAESTDGIVGVRAFMRWSWRTGDRDVSAVRAVDTATHPLWQGRKIFSSLTKEMVALMRESGVGFIFNTPNAKSMPGYLKLGWGKVARLPMWVCPLRPLAVAKAALGAVSDGNPCLHHLDTAKEVLSDSEVVRHIARMQIHDSRYHTVKDSRYLRWRYADVPRVDYRAVFLNSGDDAALLICRGRRRTRLREITVCDLLASRSLRGVRLARRAIRLAAQDSEADHIAGFAAMGTREQAVFAMSGFIPTPRIGPYLTAQSLNNERPSPLRLRNWRATVGDLELF